MINGFLNVSRLQSGKFIIEKTRFDLVGFAKETIEDISFSVSSHQFIFDNNEIVLIEADHNKIGAVISNLVSNAVKYSPPGTVVMIQCIKKASQVVFSIADQGPGIAEKDKDKLFNRYYRVEALNTSKIAGFGIGLYLSAEIVRAHGGRIGVESEFGRGARFYFSLPAG